MEDKAIICDESDLRSKIYIIRGKQVMLDFDLAEIYGYTVKAFNQQVKNNIEKFDDDFRFQLIWEEMLEISKCSRSKFLTLNEKGTRGSNIKYLPYAFTEQGIYMLMTVLRGDLAIKQSKILVIRSRQVMIDRDLAELYGVETKRLNEQVRRNIERFPKDFCFQLNDGETKELVAFCDRFASMKHSTVNPYAFTEQGIAMLSSVLRSPNAVEVNIQIMRAFIAMRRFMQTNAQVFQRLERVEKHQLDSDKKIDELFDKMDRYKIEDKQGIFFQGQIFDAYAKFESFIAEAEKEIILIDNYVDLTVLERLAKKKNGVQVTIFTCPKTKITPLDIQKFNEQYPVLELNHTEKIHDRFLIIDNKILYHIGASLKDLGKKCFAFEILDSSWIQEIMGNM